MLHTISPVFDEHSRILILGSFPSVRSREEGFFYGHPQNRFWKVLSALTGEKTPLSVSDKKAFLLRNGIALWDVIGSCEITGSADAAIRKETPNDLASLLSRAPIRRIYLNGGKAAACYTRFFGGAGFPEAVRLPSTSPANAAFSLSDLIGAWRTILSDLK